MSARSLWAQNVDSIGVQPLQPQSYTSSLSRIDAVEVRGSLGNVLVMDQYQRAWTSGTSLSNVIFSLRHRTLSDSTDIFAHDYHYPTWGLSLQWANLSRATMQKPASSAWGQLQTVDYASHPGHLLALVGSFSRPLQHCTWGEWGYAIEEGSTLALITKRIMPTTNSQVLLCFFILEPVFMENYVSPHAFLCARIWHFDT